jgi:EAL domain-containing protein (putative c-di-GMP-specific phosphodiesterase class I)
MEALIRWTSPELGPIPPSVFIPIAEESGMIKSIDRWSLLQACRQNKSWIDQGCMPTTVSVNISSIFLDQPDFIEEIKQILILTQHPPELLELEITERIALGGYDDVIRKLESLRNMGIKISIDDFGTGYSSLNYLQNLPIQRIKIDQSFVRDLPHNQQVIGIVNRIISMGNHFGLELIAEGVENHQQLSFIVKQGCHFIQGYYYSKPLTHAEMQQLLYKGIIHPNGKH